MRTWCWILGVAVCLSGTTAWGIDPAATVFEPPPALLPSATIQQVANVVTAETPEAERKLSLVLQQWTAVGAGVRTLDCKFVRQEYDTEHQTETRGHGRICYEADGRAMYALEPYPLQSNSKSNRTTPRGVPYKLQVPKAETLYWISGAFARVNPTAAEYELFEVPEPFWSTGIVEATESFDVLWTTLGCLERYVPGLVETDETELRQRFAWTLVTHDAEQIVLKGTPLTAAEQRHYSAVYVYLHAKNYLTRGLKTVDNTGAREVLQTFSEMKVNATPAANTPDWAPNIGGMRLLTPPPLAPPAE